MTTLLLIVIYIAFIGLGIPDSLFGTAWPAIYVEFGLPVASANYVTLLTSGCTILSSLFSPRLTNRFGTEYITLASTAMTAAALLGFSCSGKLIWLCLFAVPLGLGAGAIDTALNHYVALRYKATHMNFLHCFYGIGVSLSPWLMSLSLSTDSEWRNGYRSVFWLQLSITLLLLVSLPLWKKVRQSSTAEENTLQDPPGLRTLIRMPRVRTVCMIFFGSCAIEYTCGTWGSTFLVTQRGMTPDQAAKFITLYYIGMASGRFLAGVLAGKLTSWQLVRTGQALTLLSILLLLLPLPPFLSGAALFLTGIGNAPVFPNMLHLTPENFGEALSRYVMGIQMTASYFGIMLAPALFGLLAQGISTALFPWYLLALFLVMIRNCQK